MQLALTGDIPICGFVVVAPGGGIIDKPNKLQSLIEETRNHKLNGIIIRGTEDLSILRDKLTNLVKILNNGGISCEFIEVPNLGHWYPLDMAKIVTSFLTTFE